MAAQSFFDTDEWLSAYENLKTKAREFSRLYNSLQNYGDIAALDPELARRRQKLLNEGASIYTTIENMRSFANTVYNMTNNYGLAALHGEKSGLGVFWIPVVAVVSAVSAITYWISNARAEIQNFDLIRQLQSEGYTTQQAIDAARGGKRPLTEIADSIKWIVGGILGLIVLRKLM